MFVVAWATCAGSGPPARGNQRSGNLSVKCYCGDLVAPGDTTTARQYGEAGSTVVVVAWTPNPNSAAVNMFQLVHLPPTPLQTARVKLVTHPSLQATWIQTGHLPIPSSNSMGSNRSPAHPVKQHGFKPVTRPSRQASWIQSGHPPSPAHPFKQHGFKPASMDSNRSPAHPPSKQHGFKPVTRPLPTMHSLRRGS